ncbi:hypothetical protein [[Erwinia] mediterraneensis]|uniref:hypothetical protein n=1 Tax=[Erwinia] mediterraneensis TaxID=2161819 RepID=UPI001A93334A|nr:hypothetical protein [[Erwinia] mediterraneensis]
MTIKRYNQAFHEMAGGFMQAHHEGEYVKWEDVEELAAELCAVEQIHSEAVFVTDEDYEQCPSNVQNIIRHLAVMKMPAYEALANQLRAEGIHFVANRMLAAWESGFIDDTPEQALDISGAVLSTLEFLPNASPEEFKRDYADEVRSAIDAQLRDKGGSNG